MVIYSSKEHISSGNEEENDTHLVCFRGAAVCVGARLATVTSSSCGGRIFDASTRSFRVGSLSFVSGGFTRGNGSLKLPHVSRTSEDGEENKTYLVCFKGAAFKGGCIEIHFANVRSSLNESGRTTPG